MSDIRLRYANVVEDYLSAGFTVIPAKGKRPIPAGATGRNGTVTPEKMRAWAIDFEWAMQNTAIRHGKDTIAIDVDHYGDSTGAHTLAELEAKLGELPATPSSTSRGADSPSRQHFFILPEQVELLDQAGPHIDIIQFHHRYSLVYPSVNPAAGNAPYEWYDADGELMEGVPTVGDFEVLPQAWVDYLRAPERGLGAMGEGAYSAEAPQVPQVETASDDERRQVDSAVAELRELPRVWTEGAGWRSTMFRVSCWLLRMANSPHYALTVEQAKELVFRTTPTDDNWGTRELLEQWASAITTTAGQYADVPNSARPELLTALETFNALTPSVYDLAMKEPSSRDAGQLWDIRSRIIRDSLQAGLVEVVAASAAWHAGFAGEPLRADHTGLTKLWREVDKAKLTIALDGGAMIAAAPAGERPALPSAEPSEAVGVRLLTAHENTYLLGDGGRWWGLRYMEWALQTFPMVNEPYFRLNRWFVLSSIFGNKAVIPMPGALDMILNMSGVIVGPSGSGKSEAFQPVLQTLKAYYQGADNPDIGDNATYAALTKVLIARDGKTSLFHVDEADSTLVGWSDDKGEFRGMKQGITKFYDGTVPAIQRSTDTDISGIHAKAYLSTHLMGTVEKMVDAIQPDDWESGFINRFVWARGEKKPRSRAQKRFTPRTGGRSAPKGDAMYRQWAAEFTQASNKIARTDGELAEVLFDDDVLDRHLDMVEALEVITNASTYRDRLQSTFTRLNNTVMKCAAMVAVSEGELTVQMRHLLIVMQQAEEWATNILFMVQATNKTRIARSTDRLEVLVAENPNGRMPLAAILRHPEFPRGRRDTGEMIAELVAQGRAGTEKDPLTGEEMVFVKH